MKIHRKTIRLLSALLVASAASAAAAQQPSPSVGPPLQDNASGSTGGWEKLNTEPYSGKRDDIAFSDRTHGWYGTGKGDLFGTADGGRSWTKIASRPGTFIRALGFVNDRVGFIGNIGTGYYPGVTDTVPLYRTDDGGATWFPIDLHGASVPGICSIDILRTQQVFQGSLVPQVLITAVGRVGGPAAMIRSTDGGATWQSTDMSRWTQMILDVHFIDEQTGFVAGSSARDVSVANAQILMTRDGGKSWTEVYRSVRPKELIWKMSFPSRRVGYATVMSYDQAVVRKVLTKTTDGGKTWQELPLVEDGKAVELGVGFVDARHGWVGTTIGGFETKDGGRSFTPVGIAKAANKFRVVESSDGSKAVFAIGTAVQRLQLSAARR